MAVRKRFVLISNVAAPYQVRFCAHLQKHFDTEFWFYEHMGPKRPAWWKIDLPPGCRLIGKLIYKRNYRYVTFEVIRMLKEFDPDVVMLGGFFIPSNYLAYSWARAHGKKVIMGSEALRKGGKLRGRSLLTRLIGFAYRNVDAVFAVPEMATEQLRKLFPHLSSVTHTASYSADIDGYFEHPLRQAREGYRYLFPNRLTDIYNPLLAIEIFAEVLSRYPASTLRLNQHGELLPDCQRLIARLGLEDSVQFLDEITHWDDLSEIYRESDILLFPAAFSNGNLTILECMASGMGIVISDKILSQSDWLREQGGAFVRPPEKAEFVDAILQYVGRPELLREHAEVNRVLAKPWSGEGTAKLYADLINKKVLGE